MAFQFKHKGRTFKVVKTPAIHAGPHSLPSDLKLHMEKYSDSKGIVLLADELIFATDGDINANNKDVILAADTLIGRVGRGINHGY